MVLLWADGIVGLLRTGREGTRWGDGSGEIDQDGDRERKEEWKSM